MTSASDGQRVVGELAHGVRAVGLLAARRHGAAIDRRAWLGDVATIEVLEREVVAVLEVLVTDRRADLEVRLGTAPLAAMLVSEDQLILEHPGIGELREAVGVLVDVVERFVEQSCW